MRTKGAVVLTIVLAGGFLYGLWRLYQLRFEAGDIYPPYSSLRADPLGAKALYESIQELPGMSAARNYQPVASLAKTQATVVILGQDPFIFEIMTEDEVKEYEALAAGGARVIVAMRPVRRLPEPNVPKTGRPPSQSVPPGQAAIQKRWDVTFDYLTSSLQEANQESSGEPKVTALYFRSGDKNAYEFEKQFGAGSVVLLANSYLWTNEALAGERDTQLLARMLAGYPLVIFDESHFGLTESGSVGALVRKYRLEGVVAMLAVLLALFVWKNSTSFLPPRVQPSDADDSVWAKDAGTGLANLLRRNIPGRTLLKTCWNEWEQSQHGGRHYSRAKIERARALVNADGDAAETYREVSRILAEKT
jgi:hypothetical protein